jgi:hypothetical protein
MNSKLSPSIMGINASEKLIIPRSNSLEPKDNESIPT